MKGGQLKCSCPPLKIPVAGSRFKGAIFASSPTEGLRRGAECARLCERVE